ncbi:MAG: hypothetical protein JSS30_00685 [Verrucomicrobia bacterium]|nr:hypothetical protein [Verrucomicrobiota bacterium]
MGLKEVDSKKIQADNASKKFLKGDFMQVERDYGRWQLPQNLEELSEGGSYPGILREWELDYVEHLAPGEDSQTCLCTHHPIREVCHIVNLQNAQTAIVGNCCIKKFEKEEAGAINFGGTHKVFDALKRIEKDESARANQELLDYAISKKILTQAEYDKYSQLWTRRNFYDSEWRFIRNANRKIIEHANSRAMKEFNASKKRERDTANQAGASKQQGAVQQVAPRTWAQLPAPTLGPMQQNSGPAAVRASVQPTQVTNLPPAAVRAIMPVQMPSINPRSHTGLSSLPAPVLSSPVSSQPSVTSVSTPIAPEMGLAQLLAQLRLKKDSVAQMSLVRAAREQHILDDKEFGFYEQMVQAGGRYALSPKQQSWLSSLNKKMIERLQVNATPVRVATQPTPRILNLADSQTIQNAYQSGLIKEKDKEFYLSLIQRKPTRLSDGQQNWVNDVHKKIQFEDDHTEVNTRPAKRALVLE